MNVVFWKKHQKTTLEEATRLLAQSHREVLELIEVFNNDELFTKGVYKWTGGTSLGSYLSVARQVVYILNPTRLN